MLVLFKLFILVSSMSFNKNSLIPQINYNRLDLDWSSA